MPCDLIFEGKKKYIQKIEKLITNSEKKTVEGVAVEMLPEMKVAEVQSVAVEGGLDLVEVDERKAK